MSQSIAPVLTDVYLPLYLSRKSVLHQMGDDIEWNDKSDKTFEIDREISKFKDSLILEDKSYFNFLIDELFNKDFI